MGVNACRLLGELQRLLSTPVPILHTTHCDPQPIFCCLVFLLALGCLFSSQHQQELLVRGAACSAECAECSGAVVEEMTLLLK